LWAPWLKLEEKPRNGGEKTKADEKRAADSRLTVSLSLSENVAKKKKQKIGGEQAAGVSRKGLKREILKKKGKMRIVVSKGSTASVHGAEWKGAGLPFQKSRVGTEARHENQAEGAKEEKGLVEGWKLKNRDVGERRKKMSVVVSEPSTRTRKRKEKLGRRKRPKRKSEWGKSKRRERGKKNCKATRESEDVSEHIIIPSRETRGEATRHKRHLLKGGQAREESEKKKKKETKHKPETCRMKVTRREEEGELIYSPGQQRKQRTAKGRRGHVVTDHNRK